MPSCVTVKDFWDDALGTIQVKTPDRSMDIMLNRLAALSDAGVPYLGALRLLSGERRLRIPRSAAGRHGARVVAAGDHARALLRAAARQFREGDVQHWWLPPTGQGVRTRISDDRVWLPMPPRTTSEASPATSRSWMRSCRSSKAADAAAGEHDAYFQPAISDDSATLFEHCARALDAASHVGAHGLPLIGTGDWNDGMNRVGEHGRGESVWLGWFLYATLGAFAPSRSARERAERALRNGWRTPRR